MKLRRRDGFVPLDRTIVMGVLNVTPDSFSDGGLWLDPEAAVAHGLEMASHGAAIIDVGGESTRPGSTPVSEEEELRRVIPVLEELSSSTDAAISIDTRKAVVARRAIEAGASIINETSGEDYDGSIDAVAAETDAAIIVMHSRGTSQTMQSLTDYHDVVSDVRGFLATRAQELEDAGVPGDAIAVDPGIGFAKTAEQNLLLLKDLKRLAELGYPLVVGTSRKSFIGAVLDVDVDERVEGTAATVAWAVVNGAQIVRVHDVEAMVRVVRMTEAIRNARVQT